MTSPSRRRCLWPGCPLPLHNGAHPALLHCQQHRGALTPVLSELLRVAYGTPEWLPAIRQVQDYAREVIAWRKTEVSRGELHADSNAPAG